MCHQKSWLKNVNYRDRSRRWNRLPMVSQKLSSEKFLSCEDVPETHLHVCQVNGEEEARQIVMGTKCAAGIKCWWLFQVLASQITTRLKRKIGGLESLG